ncbi:MAG: lipoyl(octanoyl) transferase LipB [Candidatus Kapabacteria bacterium]|nr:lipoyl(octanoyl) transferase LipB [Candidatus Kapabacteria bacterium]
MFEVQDWGLIDYQEAWDRQNEIVKDIQANRNRNVLVLCEHPSVITVGKNGHDNNIIPTTEFLNSLGLQVIYNNRGGDVTLHNPKQLVGYPIFNLSSMKEDLHWFLRKVEETIIDVIANWNLVGDKVEGLTGVWLEEKRKICAMGFHCSRWVTSHGFALNVANALEEFNYIIPCGITDKEVTSISKETGTEIDMSIVKQITIESFKKQFGF